jgi:hypothetical protein
VGGALGERSEEDGGALSRAAGRGGEEHRRLLTLLVDSDAPQASRISSEVGLEEMMEAWRAGGSHQASRSPPSPLSLPLALCAAEATAVYLLVHLAKGGEGSVNGCISDRLHAIFSW